MDKTIWSSFLGETWDKDKKVGAPFLLILLGFYVFFRPSNPATRTSKKLLNVWFRGFFVFRILINYPHLAVVMMNYTWYNYTVAKRM